MPQLDPHPWFLTFMCAWLVLTVIILPNMLAHTYPGVPGTKNAKTLRSQPLHMLWS